MKKFLSLVLALVMTMSLVTVSAGAKDFTDNDELNYEEAVAVMSDLKVLGGYADGSFNPQGNLTRQAAAKIICNLILGPTTASALRADTAPFKDVAVTNDFAGYITYCAQQGIINGYADGTFRPTAPLTGYAFMKMLLGALGYDGSIEGYTGPNWSVQVAKRAIGIGLNAGLVDSFNGVKSVNREEAALYAFNTLKSTMVEYDSRTTVSVGGADVVIAGSAAKDVANTARVEGIKDDGKLQFAEKYFTKLSVDTETYDCFGRPANTWTYNKKEIGSYVDYTLKVAEYTTSVTGKELASLIGKTAIDNSSVEYYVDGAPVTTEIKNSNMIKSNGRAYASTGNGVLTEVFVNTDEDEIIVTSINTFFATVNGDYNEKKEVLNVATAPALGAAYDTSVKAEDVAGIEDYKDGDVVYLTYAWDGVSDYNIVDVKDPADAMSDVKITKYKTGNYVVTGGEQYDYAEKINVDDALKTYTGATELTKNTYNVYLDEYGYALGVVLHSGESNYVFITGFDKARSSLTKKTAEAAAIFINEDGEAEMKNILIDFKASNDNIANPADKLDDGGYPCLNRWYSYTVGKNDIYTLDDATMIRVDPNADMKINTSHVRLDDGTTKVWGNEDSVYVTVEAEADVVDGVTIDGVKYDDAITEVTGSYTAVQDVDLLVKDTTYGIISHMIYALYDNTDKYIVAAIVIGADNTATANYAYALKGAQNEYVDEGDYYYWDFIAFTEGEVKTLTVKTDKLSTIDRIAGQIGTGKSSLFELTYDKDGYVIEATLMTDTANNDVVYGNNYDWDTDIVEGDEVLYSVNWTSAYKANFTIYSGRTLVGDADRGGGDAGLTLAKGAPVVVIQPVKEVDSNGAQVDLYDTYETYNSLDVALKSLAGEGDAFEGWVSAILDERGMATAIFISDTAPITVLVDDGSVPGGNSDIRKVALAANGTLTVTGGTAGVNYAWTLYSYTPGSSAGYVAVDSGVATLAQFAQYGVAGMTANTSYYIVIDGVESNVVKA